MLESIFVLMPAYNAGKTVEKVFARIPPAARRRVRRYAVVDDGSSDDTAAVLGRLRALWPDVTVLAHPQNRGYGEAMKTLLGYARAEGADAAVVLHADGQYSPEAMEQMLRPIEDGSAEMVQGSRMLGGGALRGGMPLYKYVANRALTAIENRAFGLRMAEYHSGYMAYGRRALAEIPFEKLSRSFDFDLEMMVMARVTGMRIAEVAIPTIYADEVSHLKPVDYGLRVLGVVRRYRRGEYARLAGR
jgi:glycosyltransferase involved in cell wall biosynthesis